jgi:3-methyl-2-oxobutanoate hydroxymethyltransferase
MLKRVTVPDIMEAKGERKLSMITAYDYPTGRLADLAGMDMVLVGDSLAMVVLGREDTLSVTMEEMIHHTKAASRGVERALLVSDMPFMSYQESVEQALRNAGRLIKEGRAQAVKIEGGAETSQTVRALTDAGIPVMGHVGLTPQRQIQLGGFRYQGKTVEAARILVEDAKALSAAGAFSLVVECVPAETAQAIADAVGIPVIGIGAGPHCDGQVLVVHDMIGLFDRFKPRFVKSYAEFWPQALKALESYRDEVATGVFPGEDQTHHMTPEELERVRRLLGQA